MSNEFDFSARKAALEAELTQSAQIQREEEQKAQYSTTRQVHREQTYTPKGSRTDRNLLNMASGVVFLFAVIDLVFALPNYCTGASAARILDSFFGLDMESYFTMLWIISLGGILFRLVCGVLGVVFCDEPKRAKICLILGIIMFLPGAYAFIISLDGGMLDILFGAAALLLPGVYIAGAVKTMKGDF